LNFGVHLGFGLVGMATSRVRLFAAETGIVMIMRRNSFWGRARLEWESGHVRVCFDHRA
jgi:hypothetical protein